MKDPEARRKWRFRAEDFENAVFYLGPNGEERDDEEEWIGTDREAEDEGDRRSDLWEVRTGGCLDQITRESRGRVEEGNT